jgi:pantetheine-phosphate adenylyltransferase
VETVFLTPSDQFAHLSSSFVREIHTLGGDVQALVSPAVLQGLKDKHPQQGKR